LFSDRLGVDLIANPDKACDPDIAATILIDGMVEGLFTGHKLRDLIGEVSWNFREARRIINGTDRAEHIAELANLWMAFLKGNP